MIASRYEILSTLGRGGMGMVYKAHDRVLDETVAVKVLRSDLGDQRDLARRFLSEIKLARRVRHPNVCAIHEYGEDGPTHYISMEFVDGIDLRQTLKAKGAFPAEHAARLASEIARGLQAIHDLGIVHRDLKTSNVMVDASQRIRLMDFGIAKKVDSDTHATATGSIVGTPEYMSPEQARGGRADIRSDVYSLGVLTYELVTGRVPFRAETPVGILMKHIQDRAPIEDVHSAGLQAIVARALEKEPENRFQTAREMAAALEAVAGATRPTVVGPVAMRRRGATAPALARDPAVEPTVVPTQAPTAVPTFVPTTGSSAATEVRSPTIKTGSISARGISIPPTRIAVVVIGFVAITGASYYALQDRLGGSRQPTVAVSDHPAGPALDDPAASPPSSAPREDGALVRSRPATAVRAVRDAQRIAAAKGLAAPLPARVTPPDAVHVPLTAQPTQTAPTPATAPTETAAIPPAETSNTLPAETPRAVVATPDRALPSPASTAPLGAATLAGSGLLLIQVKPEAEIAVDGKPMGRMGFFTVPLPSGSHTIVFTHPKYQPLLRTVEVAPDGRHRLTVDLKDDALPRP